jgi:hypothetical protein
MTRLASRLTPARAVVLAGVIVAAAAAFLAASGVVLSREKSLDLLFNLAGAWQLRHGGVAHVDFHDPVGQLSFRLTQIGFWLCGPTPRAFVAGEIIAAAALFAAAAAASLPRLPPVATMVFTLFTSLIVLMPVNVGDDLGSFTFAMSYNVQCWAAISILSLILFVPRRHPLERPWCDAAVGGLLMVAMYYLKITYFAAALGELMVAFVACRHVRHRAWLVVGALVVANAVAPYNWPYLTDLADVVSLPESVTGYLDVANLKERLRGSIAELLIYVLAVGIAIGLWLLGRVPWRLPATMAFLFAVGVGLLMFNTQARGIPIAVVGLLLLYRQMQDDSALRRAAPALLVFPLWLGMTAVASVVAYHIAATPTDDLLVVDSTNLRGLAVPDDDRPPRPGEAIDEDDYVETVLEAADLLKHTGNGGLGVVLLDSVNPMAFVLGLPPRRGARLWLDVFPWRAPEVKFKGANHVLVPGRPTDPDLVRKAFALYGPYLAKNFPLRTESRNWTLLSRHP